MWQTHRIACITYHKYPKDDWPVEEFTKVETRLPNGEAVSIKLAERGSWIGNRKSGLWVREVRKLTTSGHQTSLISTAFGGSVVQNAVGLFSRWSQENFFRYMMEHFAIDLLNEYRSNCSITPGSSRVVGRNGGRGAQGASPTALPWAHHTDVPCSAQHRRSRAGRCFRSLSADQLRQGKNPPAAAQPVLEVFPEVHAQPSTGLLETGKGVPRPTPCLAPRAAADLPLLDVVPHVAFAEVVMQGNLGPLQHRSRSARFSFIPFSTASTLGKVWCGSRRAHQTALPEPAVEPLSGSRRYALRSW